MLVLGFFLLNGALVVGFQPKEVGTPENITVQVIDSKTVEVFWSAAWKNVERYDVTYNPTENRVVSQAAGNSHSIILRELRPNTQYQVTVTAVVEGKNYKSRRFVFRTSADPKDTPDLEEFQPTRPTKTRKSYPVTPEIINPDPTAIGSKYTPQTSTTVRGVEIGLVLLALVVWIIAIALFFHRWGKIRMLLPYQPDYKTQQSLKVPGTGTTIVSGCTGNSSSQGQPEGPGCVQHLRWSNRFFDEPPTAKKCSPSRKPLRPRVSSAFFPPSPSFSYVRTSADCDSPRIIRHAHSHSEFPTESIPLSQVNQPRSESIQNIISITVPVIASNVNEKAHIKKKKGELTVSEPKNSDDNAIINFDDSEFSKTDKRETNFVSFLNDDVSRKNHLGFYCSHNLYRSTQTPSIERRERQKEKVENSSELKPLFFVEPADRCFHESRAEEMKTSQESEKPTRYNRSSLKKQKVRLYDDKDLNLCKNVPIYECDQNSQDRNQKPQESDNEKNQKPKDLKTLELRRKAFLRKVSLQDTYVNYNQDYWLDFKNSGRFHKSIDLGYFGKEEESSNKMETQALNNIQGPKSISEEQFVQGITQSNQVQPLAIISQSKQPSRFFYEGSLKRSDSDPIIFPCKCSCENCQSNDLEKSRNDSNELLTEIIAKNKSKETQTKMNCFFLPSNENIQLFSERNGLIETDFDMLNDMLDEECLLMGIIPKNADDEIYCPGEAKSSELEPNKNEFGASMDFSNFYEVKLTQSTESENEKKSRTFNFEGGEAFFENLVSTSEESDVSYKETASVKVTESTEFPFLFCSSFSPPKSSPD